MLLRRPARRGARRRRQCRRQGRLIRPSGRHPRPVSGRRPAAVPPAQPPLLVSTASTPPSRAPRDSIIYFNVLGAAQRAAVSWQHSEPAVVESPAHPDSCSAVATASPGHWSGLASPLQAPPHLATRANLSSTLNCSLPSQGDGATSAAAAVSGAGQEQVSFDADICAVNERDSVGAAAAAAAAAVADAASATASTICDVVCNGERGSADAAAVSARAPASSRPHDVSASDAEPVCTAPCVPDKHVGGSIKPLPVSSIRRLVALGVISSMVVISIAVGVVSARQLPGQWMYQAAWRGWHARPSGGSSSRRARTVALSPKSPRPALPPPRQNNATAGYRLINDAVEAGRGGIAGDATAAAAENALGGNGVAIPRRTVAGGQPRVGTGGAGRACHLGPRHRGDDVHYAGCCCGHPCVGPPIRLERVLGVNEDFFVKDLCGNDTMGSPSHFLPTTRPRGRLGVTKN